MFDRMNTEEKNNDSGGDLNDSAEYSNNIDSILFENDKGPASNFLNNLSSHEMKQQQIRIVTTSATPTLENEDIHGSRNVRFSDLDSLEEKKSQSEQDCGPDAIQLLRECLSQVQTDLSAERVMRKRKEKNLVKLAKELNKRTSDAHLKETTINEMTTTITELEGKLQNNHRENAQDLQTYRAACRENETKISELDSAVSALRKELLEANLEADHLRTRLSMNSVKPTVRTLDFSPNPTMKTTEKSNFSLKYSIVFMILASCTFFAVSRDILSIDAICSPVIPGSVLTTSVDGTVSAPWWAPESMKVQSFNTVCGDRPRTQISWKGDKLIVHTLSSDSSKNPAIAWQGRAPLGVKVDARGMSIKTKTGTTQAKAPWALKQI